MARIRIEDLEADETEVGDAEIDEMPAGHRHAVSYFGGKDFRTFGGDSSRNNFIRTYLRSLHRLNLK